MDIVVTIPKSRMAEVEAEEREVAEAATRGEKEVYYWTLGRKPNVVRNERCYFVWGSAIRAYHEVLGVAWDEGIGRWCVWMRPEIHNVEPVPMQSFRGFRYHRQARTVERA